MSFNYSNYYSLYDLCSSRVFRGSTLCRIARRYASFTWIRRSLTAWAICSFARICELGELSLFSKLIHFKWNQKLIIIVYRQAPSWVHYATCTWDHPIVPPRARQRVSTYRIINHTLAQSSEFLGRCGATGR